MRYLITFLIVVSFKCCFGQGARFQFYLTKACTNVEQLDTSYYLMSVKSIDSVYTPKKGTVYLPGPGRYRIGFMEGPIVDSAIVEIKDTILFIFRYREPKIQRYITNTVDTPPIYVRCDTAITGYAEDFYPNGNIKIRGNFKHGYRKDSLITFYGTGKMQSRITASPKTITIEDYDSLGNLIRLNKAQNKAFIGYREYREKEFYPDGKLKIESSSIKGIEKIKEFYPSGQIKVKQAKSDRVEYFENGVKNVVYTWKRKKSIVQNSGDFIVSKREFDENGKLLQSIIFQYWSSFAGQPELDISRSSWIVSITKYKNGVAESVVTDMDTKDYLKKLDE